MNPPIANRPAGRAGPPIVLYALWGALLVITLIVPSRTAWQVVYDLRHPESDVDAPFLVQQNGNEISNPSKQAERAGLLENDRLLAVDDVPYTGSHVVDDRFVQLRPGQTLRLRVCTPAKDGVCRPREIELPITPSGRSGSSATGLVLLIALYVVMPLFCLALGFWVTGVRPHDPLAWLLLAVLLSFSQLVESYPASWGPGWRDFAIAFRTALAVSWPIWLMLFGLSFPEPFPGRRGRIFGVAKWFIIGPLAAFGLVDVIVRVVGVENYAAAARFSHLVRPIQPAVAVLAFVAVGDFFASIFMKGSMAASRDAKRRLRLLYAGAAVSLGPLFVFVIISLVSKKTFNSSSHPWIAVVVLLLLLVFPLTLAYTIVVQRAMDVRVAIRQGLQYALARSGVRVLQSVVIIGVVIGATLLASDPNRRFPQKLEAVSFGVLGVLLIRRATDRLRVWTDRRFFRDAYNAELVLSDLGEKVRSIVETQPLLATVSERIAESLHVPQVAVLIDGSGPYQPAYALGYVEAPQVSFGASSATVRRLRDSGEPARIYREDPDSWIYRGGDVSDAERTQLDTLASELLLPITAKSNLLGFISLGQKRSEAPYTSSDLRLLKSVAMQTGFALENARLAAAVAREISQREKLDRELEIAREVQQRLFPQKLPEAKGLDYAGACRPALGVGGDYYDFLTLPEGRLGVALGDVSGKGIAAALMMATLQASLRGEALRAKGDLGPMISAVNRLVFDASTINRYATLFYAEIDVAARRLTYVNAGHNPPMLFRQSLGKWEAARLETNGTVVGLLENYPFSQAEVSLAPGDVLVIYTDGVSEAMNSADEEWGEERLMETIERCQGLSAAFTIEYIMAAADEFAGGAPQHDDMTLVVLRVLAEK